MKFAGLVSALLISSYSGFHIRRDFLQDLTQSLQGTSGSTPPLVAKTDNQKMADTIESYMGNVGDYLTVARSAIRMNLDSSQKEEFDNIVNKVTSHPEVQKLVASSKDMFGQAIKELRRR